MKSDDLHQCHCGFEFMNKVTMKEFLTRMKLQLGAVILLCMFMYVYLCLAFTRRSPTTYRHGEIQEPTIVVPADDQLVIRREFDKAPELDVRKGIGENINMNLSINVKNVNELKDMIKETMKEMLALTDRRKLESYPNSIGKAQYVRDGSNGEEEVDANQTLRKDSTNNLKHDGQATKKVRPKSFLTLFTTWNHKPEMDEVYTNTLKNWASFRPALTPVLFTDNGDLMAKAANYSWLTLNISKSVNGLPVLKQMFADAIENVESTFYGFANSDIIFDGGLMKTLLSLKFNPNIVTDSTPLLITGQRWNVFNVTKHEAYSHRNLTNVAGRRGALFQSSAEDFFISNSIYPWSSIPELVVGSLGFDNWLVLNARNQKHRLVDVTKSVTVVHQSVTDNPYLSHSKQMANYNIELLQNVFKSEMPWPRGFTNCIHLYTENKLDTVVVRERLAPAFCY